MPGSTTGFWSGTTSTGADVAAVVFPGGEAWAIYATNAAIGVVQGTVGGAVRDVGTAGVFDATLDASAVTRQSISGSVLYTNGTTTTFTGTYDASFEQTPSLAAAAGTYTGEGPAAGTTIALAANGVVTGNSGTCNFGGTATPRADGNAFNVSITFAGGTCPLGTSTVTGIAVYDGTDRSLSAAALNAARTGGMIFFGTKP